MLNNSIILLLSVLLGAILARFIYRYHRLTESLLVWSGAYLLAVSIMRIFPILHKANQLSVWLMIGLGLLFQMVLESMTKGVEHGHIHHQQISFSMILGLLTHSFLEGIPLIEGMNHTNHTCFAIALHNIPVATVLYLYLQEKVKKIALRMFYLILFAIVTPLGIWVGNNSILSDYPYHILALVAGIFLHISTTILFENTSKGHQIDRFKIIAILLCFLFFGITGIVNPF